MPINPFDYDRADETGDDTEGHRTQEQAPTGTEDTAPTVPMFDRVRGRVVQGRGFLRHASLRASTVLCQRPVATHPRVAMGRTRASRLFST